ncbi:MAG: NAD(P)-dependent oxidoreductase [Deltaproteobacteria bacterium]|nr:NAD(P)-dependent oxidoreductase [Deltaproteobacteria bacterium]
MSLRTAGAGAPLSAADIAHNFAELHPALTDSEAVAESARCLYCYDAPCTIACPTHIDVPSFIKKIANDNLKGAARVILDANPLGHSCARACPVEVLCEGSCVMNQSERRPVAIGRLQRHATDAVLAKGWKLFAPGASTGKKVAVVGAGPAGLACAQELRRAGHAVVMFDSRKQPGGLNTFGIAQYKLRPDTALAEAKTILDLGVELRTGVTVGTDLSFAQLERDFDAVFLGVGLGATQSLGIAGEGHAGVVDALSFIEQLKTRPYGTFTPPTRVLVIGGGNTAVDAATQAKRLGAASVAFVYRRSEDEAPAYDFEIALARASGCEFHWLTAPVEVVADGGRVTGLTCVKMALGAPDASGRRGVSAVAGSEHVLPCDLVIKALGQTKRVELLRGVSGVQLDGAGRVVIDEVGRTGNAKVFAGGDCVNGGKEIVNAAADGKRAAAAISTFLRGH